jgi:hypothetical protein
MVAHLRRAVAKPVLVTGCDQDVISGDVFGGDLPLIPVAVHSLDARFMPD